jgi:hypothetical protein
VADTIPHAVLSEQLEERIDGRRLVAAVFLTFEFDPGFFEQQILPVLLDVPLSHGTGLRLVQLEDALRSCAGCVAVYYDADHLVCGDAGSAHLDVQRVPVRHRTGVFHPKTVLLLLEDPEPDEEGHKVRTLLVGALSANLTRSGWWENVEAAHFEEVGEGEATRLKEDLQELLRNLKQRTSDGIEHPAADEIRKFLRDTEQRVKRISQGSFQPHFFAGGESFPDFLDRCAGEFLKGAYLEVISPYMDDAPPCAPLEELINRFGPKEVRVLLPHSRSGEVACSEETYDAVRKLRDVRWARLPASMQTAGKPAGGGERFVHAKLYRFFNQKPKRELCFVGSVNLTSAAHQKGGNWETGLLAEVECPHAPDFWLALEEGKPSAFKHEDETEPAKAGGTPLMLRYRWDRNLAEVYWDNKDNSPVLTLTDRNVELGQLGPLTPAQWCTLDTGWADRMAAMLKETSFVEVRGHTDRPGLLLVQEEGMSHKPSMLFQLTVAEILRYWAMLTPAQRTTFLETKSPELTMVGEGAELLARFKISLTSETFFDRFAGYFHSFNCLERDVREQLSARREKEADYRLFGRKYDSLGTLLRQAVSDTGLFDDVNRYVIFLCARQLCNELSRVFPDYWLSRREDVLALEADLAQSAMVRTRLAGKNQEMPSFLEWFDKWFLKRASPMEMEA